MKVLIVDDEAPARDRLRQLIEDNPDHSVIGEARNGQEAIEAVDSHAPDVVLLDIRMPGLSGIEAAHHLNGMENPPAVIFTTAYDEYAIDAFDANAVGYVLKPVRRARLEKALKHASRLSSQAIGEIAAAPGMAEQRTHLCARSHGELKLIPVNEVSRLHADQKYVRVHHDGGEHLIDESLKALEQEFADVFVRIHRGALVAVSRIDSLHRNDDGQTEVKMRDHNDPEALVISRRHLSDVKKRLKGE